MVGVPRVIAMTDEVTESLIERLRAVRTLAKLVGEAPAFLAALAQLPAAAACDATVLVEGETGTGKDLVARAIHYLSPRAPFPFVAVNCGSLADTLLEDELFGHERGAFTDAQARRPGLIAQADRGTLLLDEVGTLTLRAQIALLRVLQDKTFRALGASHEQQADVRFVAATNVPLRTLVQSGTLRADLYYRLCVFSIRLPPLRERREDIPALAAHLIAKHASRGSAVPTLSEAALAALFTFDWPGNVRELENAIIRGVQVCRRGVIEAEDLGLGPIAAEPTPPTGRSFKVLKRQLIERFEQDYLRHLIAEHGGNVSRAAAAAGKDRRDLGKLLRKYGIQPRQFSPSSRARLG
jgi:DNA-binding NtrC family response regulator